MSDVRGGPPRTEQDDYYDGDITPGSEGSYWSWADSPSRFDSGRWAARAEETLRRTDSFADCFDLLGDYDLRARE